MVGLVRTFFDDLFGFLKIFAGFLGNFFLYFLLTFYGFLGNIFGFLCDFFYFSVIFLWISWWNVLDFLVIFLYCHRSSSNLFFSKHLRQFIFLSPNFRLKLNQDQILFETKSISSRKSQIFRLKAFLVDFPSSSQIFWIFSFLQQFLFGKYFFFQVRGSLWMRKENLHKCQAAIQVLCKSTI